MKAGNPTAVRRRFREGFRGLAPGPGWGFGRRVGPPESVASRALRILAASGLLWLSLACSTNPHPPPQAPPIESYVVGASDQLTVNILPDPEIIRQVRVRPDGMISIDLIGDVQAAGRTPFEIAQAIELEIGRFKRDASVNVSVVVSTPPPDVPPKNWETEPAQPPVPVASSSAAAATSPAEKPAAPSAVSRPTQLCTSDRRTLDSRIAPRVGRT